MSHFLEEYAKNLGVKASKPVVQDHFFPLTTTKYITISNDEATPSKRYSHYNLVLELVRPVLKQRGIKVVQIAGRNPIEGVDQLLNLSFRQQSFILNESLLHLGSDGVLSHVASSKNTPTINLFGNSFPNNNRPLFSASALNINLSPKWDSKPCFSPEDPKKQINNIKPEVVAQSILKLLRINDQDINFSTLHIGAGFEQKIVEVVPTSFLPLDTRDKFDIFLRLDYGYDQDSVIRYCQSYKLGIITDKVIQPHGLAPVSKNINRLCIFIDKEWEGDGDPSARIPNEYFKFLKNQGIECVLLLKNSEFLGRAQNVYFDQVVKPYNQNKNKKLENVTKNSKFFSGKYLVEGGKEYLSYAHWKKNLDNSNIVIDTPEYWEELDHFYIYEQN